MHFSNSASNRACAPFGGFDAVEKVYLRFFSEFWGIFGSTGGNSPFQERTCHVRGIAAPSECLSSFASFPHASTVS